MIDTKAIRMKVIDLAVQGKLTERLSSDGTAEELLQLIRDTKGVFAQQWSSDESEKPFDIPDSWRWAKLGNIKQVKP